MNKLEEFLDNYKQKNTYLGYKSHLNKYFKIIKADPNTYFNKKRDYKKDVIKFWKVLMERETPALSIRNAMSVVKNFLEEYDVIIPRRTWKNLRNKMKGTRPLTIDIVPTNSQLKSILTHATAKERAICLIASSSGMRIDEILSLKPDDIDYDSHPITINIRGVTTKTGNPRITFISDEAKNALGEWLKVRDKYLLTSYKRSRNKISKDGKKLFVKSRKDEKIFPFTYAPARRAWIRLIEKAGFDKKDPTTDRYKMHIHCLRKFFRTRMSLEIPVDVVEALMGHEGYLTDAYRRYTPEQLGELYLQAMYTINVFEVPTDLSGIKEEQDLLKEENQKQQKEINDLRMELLAVKFKQIQEIQRKEQK